MARRPGVAPRGRRENACLGGKSSKKQPLRRAHPKAKPSCRKRSKNGLPRPKGSTAKKQESPARKKKKETERKKRKAAWSRSYCKKYKDEFREYQREWRANKRKDPKFVEKERTKNRIFSRKKRYAKYGLTIEDYNIMKAEQGGLCLICKGKRKRRRKPNPKKKNRDRRRHNGKRLCVDHDHKLRMVRGLLCGRCNCMIGYGDDDPWILNEGRKYLIAFRKICASDKKKR
jgi:hypothetical protein